MSAIRAIRRRLRPLRRLAEKLRTRLLEMPYLLRKPPLGSADWLIRNSVEAIVPNWRAVKPLPTPGRVYFFEDYGGRLGVLAEEFKGFDTHTYGLMTVVSQGLVVDRDR